VRRAAARPPWNAVLRNSMLWMSYEDGFVEYVTLMPRPALRDWITARCHQIMCYCDLPEHANSTCPSKCDFGSDCFMQCGRVDRCATVSSGRTT